MGYDFGLPILQIDDDIAVIDAGLARLNAAHSTERRALGSSPLRSYTNGSYLRLPDNEFSR